MATTQMRKPKAQADTPEPDAEAPATGHPTGWEHDWRNPDAKFAKDDRCVDAELARIGPR